MTGIIRNRTMNRFIQRRFPTRPNRSGAALVEFAIVAPVLLLILFASIEFIRLSMIRNLVQDAAYFAARDAMVPGATEAEAEASANQILGYMNTQGATITINNGAGLTDDSDSVTVTITVPIAENSFLVPQFSNNMEFSATATMTTERYQGYYNPN